MMDSTLNDISQLIRIKEKELHEIHDQRCIQLEQLVNDRDALLTDAGKRFEQLKDDFQYNLALLEARDHEIERLEGHAQKITDELSITDKERRSLKSQVEILEIKEAERLEKHEENKLANKRILQELKDVIESMRWASAEETKLKTKEIEHYKSDIQRLTACREDSLEMQRRDLTNTFEALLVQREESFNSRERDIGIQVSALDRKFDVLQTENSRLKLEILEWQRKMEYTSDDAANKGEQLRLLQWRMDDERNMKQQGDDQDKRRMNQLSSDLSAARERAAHDALETAKLTEKANSDLQRERDYRINLEKSLLDCQSNAAIEIKRLTSEITEGKRAESTTRDEVLYLRDERDKLNEKCRALQAEKDLSSVRSENAIRDLEALRMTNSSAQSSCNEYEQRLLTLQQELLTAKQLTATEQRDAADRLDAAERQAARIVDLENRVAIESERAQKQFSRVQEMEEEVLLVCQERDDAMRACKDTTAELKEEHIECNALRLRLSMHEAQAVETQQQLQRLHSEQQRSEAFSLGLVVGAGVESEDVAYVPSNVHSGGHFYNSKSLELEGLGVSSLIFSEDFGPTSVLNSPAISGSRDRDRDRVDRGSCRSDRMYKEQFAYMDTNNHQQQQQQQQQQQMYEQQNHHLQQYGEDMRSDEYKNNTNEFHNEPRDPVTEENERLKSVIREMRLDVESLQRQVSEPQSTGQLFLERGNLQEMKDKIYPESQREKSDGVGANFGMLEQRLEQTVSEVTRLRNERTRLMDVGNELRAALNRQTLPASFNGLSGQGLERTQHTVDTPYATVPMQNRGPRSDPSNTGGYGTGRSEPRPINFNGYTGDRVTAWTDKAHQDSVGYDQVRGTDSLRTPLGSMGHAVVRGSALKGHTGDKGSSSGRNHYGQSSPDEYHHGQQYGGRNGDLQLPPRDSPRQPVTSTSSIPIAITNTNRATLSQVKARKRLQQSSQKTPTDVPPRRILNYARGNDDDDVR